MHSTPGNIAITPSGRKFLSIHGFYGKKQKTIKLLTDGTTKPYPNKEWAHAYNGLLNNLIIFSILNCFVEK
jgi:hypothetical protein